MKITNNNLAESKIVMTDEEINAIDKVRFLLNGIANTDKTIDTFVFINEAKALFLSLDNWARNNIVDEGNNPFGQWG